MSYRRGYKFRVSSTRFTNYDGKMAERLPELYDVPWDHSVPPDAQHRKVIATLADGEKVEVLEYTNGAVKVRTLEFDLEGWLG